jgi:hypothetical protein
MGDSPEGAAPPRFEPHARRENVGAKSCCDRRLNQAPGRDIGTFESIRRN